MRAVLAAAMLCLVVPVHAETGLASVYWEGRLTADGERLCTTCFTAAHRTLPFGTLARVCLARRARGLQSGVSVRHRSNAGTHEARCITVRINDRGPYVHGRIIDLTPAAARALGFSGLAHVTVEPYGRYRPHRGDFGFF